MLLVTYIMLCTLCTDYVHYVMVNYVTGDVMVTYIMLLVTYIMLLVTYIMLW